jgi:hypothetical protein
MGKREVAGWTLHDYDREFRPMMEGPGELIAEVDDYGDLMVSGYEGRGTLAVPMVAISALLTVHERWLKTR